MADSEKPKKTRGRPKKKTYGKKRAQNVPSENLSSSQREKGRKRKNYLAKKRSSEAFDPGDEAGGGGVDTDSASETNAGEEEMSQGEGIFHSALIIIVIIHIIIVIVIIHIIIIIVIIRML